MSKEIQDIKVEIKSYTKTLKKIEFKKIDIDKRIKELADETPSIVQFLTGMPGSHYPQSKIENFIESNVSDNRLKILYDDLFDLQAVIRIIDGIIIDLEPDEKELIKHYTEKKDKIEIMNKLEISEDGTYYKRLNRLVEKMEEVYLEMINYTKCLVNVQ